MNTIPVDELMRYCRADDDAEGLMRSEIAALGESAEEYLRSNGVAVEADDPQVSLCVKARVLYTLDPVNNADVWAMGERILNRLKDTHF